jgi:hypothetical protein
LGNVVLLARCVFCEIALEAEVEDEGCCFGRRGEVWRIRKQREGTVVRFEGSASVMKRDSGRVRLPPSRAEIVT